MELVQDVDHYLGSFILYMLIAVILVINAWGLIEIAIQMFQRHPDGGIEYRSDPITDIIAKSLKNDS